MSEKPIIFKPEMVKAILEGTKTQTRRIINPQPEYYTGEGRRELYSFKEGLFALNFHPESSLIIEHSKIKPGDILWVRETFQMYPASVILNGTAEKNPYKKIPKEKPDSYYIEYKATSEKALCGKWRSSIFLNKYASRLFLKVKSIRVERLLDISEADAKAEGIKRKYEGCLAAKKGLSGPCPENCPEGCSCLNYKELFLDLWESINAKRGYSWKTNPWVWVIEFRRIDK